MNIWLLVALAVAIVLGCILILRLHAFLTLLLAGLTVAALGGPEALQRYTSYEVAKGEMTLQEAADLKGNQPPFG